MIQSLTARMFVQEWWPDPRQWWRGKGSLGAAQTTTGRATARWPTAGPCRAHSTAKASSKTTHALLRCPSLSRLSAPVSGVTSRMEGMRLTKFGVFWHLQPVLKTVEEWGDTAWQSNTVATVMFVCGPCGLETAVPAESDHQADKRSKFAIRLQNWEMTQPTIDFQLLVLVNL